MAAPRHILVITYWSYADALVQTYTLPYLRIMARVLPPGSRIHLVTLEKPGIAEGPPSGIDGLVHHTFPYKPFGASGMGMLFTLVRKLRRVVRQERIDTIHAWCTPAGMIGHLLSILTGRPLVIDSYEPHAEAMVENGTWKRGGIAHRVLFHFERLQSRRASVLIAAAAGMQEYARIAYGITGKPFFVKPACVDLERFSLDRVKDPELLRSLGLENKLVAVYAGKFGGIYLDQEVFDLLRVARDHWGERFHVLLLTGSRPEELRPFMDRSGLDPSLFTIRMVPHAEVPRYMGLGDIGLTPVRPVPTKRYCTPIKDGEYWALGLPVIITPNISDDSAIIERHGIGAVVQGMDRDAYRSAIRRMDELLAEDPVQRRRRIRAVAENYRHFRIAEQVYATVYGNA